MEQLIQALTTYTSTLEQHSAALEARVAQLEAKLHNCELTSKIEQLEQQLAEQATQIAALKAMLAAPAVPAAPAEEPEIEVELVMEDEEESPLQLPLEGQGEEPEIEVELILEEEELDNLDGLDSLDILEETEDSIEPEPVMEEQVVEEPVVEPVVEPAPVIEPAPRPTPTQTSLFGSAVDDIRQAISLGDRFLFQRELFAGNGELMQKTLDELNGLGSLEEAMDYVADNFEWDSDSTAVQLFENVLKRRFG